MLSLPPSLPPSPPSLPPLHPHHTRTERRRYIADDFVAAEKLPSLLPVSTLVVARAMPTEESAPGGALPLSLRRSDVEGGVVRPVKSRLAFEDVHVGMVRAGVVKSVTDFGVFVRLDASSIDALCYKTELSDEKV